MKDILQYIKIHSYLILACILATLCTAKQSWGFFKSIPESPPLKPGYLSFQAPPKLKFHELEPLADRRKLLTLNQQNVNIETEQSIPKEIPDTSFPLANFNEENSSTPVYVIPSDTNTPELVDDDLLPPNDPFVSQDLPEPNLNNTDELIEILESNIGAKNRRIETRVEFVPPYTLDGGNMVIDSKTKYTRRAR